MRVLVCVTGQKNCERLIRAGSAVAKENGLELSVLHVAKPGTGFLGSPVEGEAIEYLYGISSEYGADMTVLRAEDVIETIAQFARKNEALVIIMGRAAKPGTRDFAREIALRIPETEVRTVYSDE